MLSWSMDKNKILKEAQAELQRHTWGTFVDKGVSFALGGNGIVVPGCEGMPQAHQYQRSVFAASG